MSDGGKLVPEAFIRDSLLAITKQSAWLPVTDEQIVDSDGFGRAISEMLGVPFEPTYTADEIAAAQGRIDARLERQRAEWAALPLRKKARRRYWRWKYGLRLRSERLRESAALRLAPWLRPSEDD